MLPNSVISADAVEGNWFSRLLRGAAAVGLRLASVAVGPSTPPETLDSESVSMDFSSSLSVENENLPTQLTLTRALRSYVDVPSDIHLVMVRAALTSRDPDDHITAGELEAAAGSRGLLLSIFESGAPLAEDTAQIVRDLIAQCVVPQEDFYNRVSPHDFEYITALLRLPSALLTQPQVRLLRESGYEFVTMLDEVKHAWAHLPPPHVCSPAYWLERSRALDVAIIVGSVLSMWIQEVMISLIIAFWYQVSTARATATAAFQGVGLLIGLGLVSLAHSTKEPDSTYGELAGEFPTPLLKFIPAPIFESVVVVKLMKHAWRGSQKILRHDLQTMATLSIIFASTTLAAPQLLLQSALFQLVPQGVTASSARLFATFTAFAMLHWILAFILFLQLVTLWYSTNAIGFAAYAAHLSKRHVNDGPKHRVVMYVQTQVAVSAAFFIFLAFLSENCATTDRALAWVVVGLLAGGIVAFAMGYIVKRDARRAHLWSWPILAVLTMFTTIASFVKAGEEASTCNLLFAPRGVNAPVNYTALLAMALMLIGGAIARRRERAREAATA